jgi:aminopeptidase-like protein
MSGAALGPTARTQPPPDQSDADDLGRWLHGLCEELFPICRSITGDGVRETLAIVNRHVPLQVHEVPSGTSVFDWVVPDEWNVRDAYVLDDRGERVIDFRTSTLHLVSYSTPVHRSMSLTELREHLFTLPDRPDWIPYRTSYYQPNWGFCLSHRKLEELRDGTYEVVIDTSLVPGSLTYGEVYLPGATTDEFLLTAHICHPSLANDNLSGIALLTRLGAHLGDVARRYSYRLLFIPGTIGSITWLARNEPLVDRVQHGLVLSGLAGPGGHTYKRSRRGQAGIDRIVEHVLATSGDPYDIVDFSPYGYDERQFCSPGFNLPVGRFGRTPFGEYPEYHTSADDLSFVSAEQLADSYRKLASIVEVVEGNGRYRNLNPKCEPQLGKRGLYRSTGGAMDAEAFELALLWVLNMSDESHSLLDVAIRAQLPFAVVSRAAGALVDAGLLEPPDATRA